MNPQDPGYDSGQYQPPPLPPRRRRRRILLALAWAGAGLAGLIITITVLAAAFGGGSHVTGQSSPGTPVTFSPAPSAPDSSSPAPSPSDSLTGPVGTEFTVTSQDNSGNDVKYGVTADKITDPASGADQYTTPDSGKRFIGVEFTVTGISGYSSDDANSDAIILGDNGQTYSADFSSISAGTNFNSGNFGVRSGQTQVGWVTFQVPRGVKVASVQWQPGLGDQQPATWTK